MDVTVIGCGYVGLVTGTCLASLGHTVRGVEKDPRKLKMLQDGHCPVFEPGLQELMQEHYASGQLQFTGNVKSALKEAEVVYLAVGTPPKDDGTVDMSFLEGAGKEVCDALVALNNEYMVTIVVKSTVPAGTNRKLYNFLKQQTNAYVQVVSNPEFLREGSAIADTLQPDRIVIGAPSQVVAMRILELYAPLERPMLITDVVSAEMIKYASNAFLATKISFINAIADVCEAAGADVTQVMKGMGYDHRIGAAFLQAGLGYGGSCFPKDTKALIRTAERHGCDFAILRDVVRVNEERVGRFMDRLEGVLGGLADRTVAVLGLAFKANTDDMRDAKSLDVIARLLASGANVRAYDPIAMARTREVFPQIHYGENAYDAVLGADAAIVVTEWNEFRHLNLERIREAMRGDVLFDGRNVYDPVRMQRLGFAYYGVGRGGLEPVAR